MFYLKKNPFIIRKIKTLEKKIFLTFDDGPDQYLTKEVLDLLQAEKWKATFFVVGIRAEKNLDLIGRMINEGHGLMSHSFDHAYSPYFKGEKSLKKWLQKSLQNLSDLTGLPQKTFRPPAGILTPPLVKVAQELNIPLVLWNRRYFDTHRALSFNKVQKHLSQLSCGDIVLLHDRQALGQQKPFLRTLRHYIREMKSQGYTSGTLSSDLIQKQITAEVNTSERFLVPEI